MSKKKKSKKSNPKNYFQNTKAEVVKGMVTNFTTARNKEEQKHLPENTCKQGTKNSGVLPEKKN